MASDTIALNTIKIERISGTRFVRLLEDFKFRSKILKRICTIPKGFVYDEESIPILKGTNPEAGAIHDYLCRRDSSPVVTKEIAAQVYLEFQEYYDNQETGTLNAAWDWVRRRFKRDVVMVAPGYFHRHSVNATAEDLIRGYES